MSSSQRSCKVVSPPTTPVCTAVKVKVLSSLPVYSPITRGMAVEAPVPVGCRSRGSVGAPTPAHSEGSSTRLLKLGVSPPSSSMSRVMRPTWPVVWLVSTSW